MNGLFPGGKKIIQVENLNKMTLAKINKTVEQYTDHPFVYVSLLAVAVILTALPFIGA